MIRPLAWSPAQGLRSRGSVESDRAALVAFYHATDGDNWANNEGWLTDAPLNDWYGVSAQSGRDLIRLNPNPPKDTAGRREDSGGGVRELQGR